jgi:glycosyltransferase involved in cell wall biosynthesis
VVVSVHDVSFLEHPEYFPFYRALQLRLTVRHTIRNAARILTGSEFSRDSIARAYNLDPDRIAVVPNAAAGCFHPVRREAALRYMLKRFGIAAPFVLSVGDLQPRKNHIGLIEAFARMVHARPQFQHYLLLAGKETWFARRVRDAAKRSGVSDRIRFLGFVSDDDLLHLYNACDLFCFPSFYEGFGLPVLEAMACGAPVACSNRSAIPEVADGASIFFDPDTPDEITRAMLDLIQHQELQARTRRLGLQRAADFSWRKTAQQTLEVYYEVLEQCQSVTAGVVPAPISPQ